MARSRPKWPESLFFSDVPSQTRVANHFAVAPSVHGVPHLHGSMLQFDAARRAASNHLGGAFSRQRHADESGLQGLHLARRAQSVGASHHQHAEDDPPARPFRSAERARVSNASLHTLVPPRCSHSHVAHADCMVLESRAACLQMLQGLSCNRRADASGTSLTQRSSLVDVLDHQEAAEAAHYDMEITWRACRARPCGAPRVACDAHGRLGALLVLDAGHFVRPRVADGRLRSRGRG